ncbi:hypothetical protein CHARACLAT_013654 [Characodon lateralis]|uniref:Uncharacterized protein n=1 Tax=Characodon lateralis TaxID=208331 RepID=A0ABU7CXX6_9TELE|nr:hypothetical protein [Characodon lateralis]
MYLKFLVLTFYNLRHIATGVWFADLNDDVYENWKVRAKLLNLSVQRQKNRFLTSVGSDPEHKQQNRLQECFGPVKMGKIHVSPCMFSQDSEQIRPNKVHLLKPSTVLM